MKVFVCNSFQKEREEEKVTKKWHNWRDEDSDGGGVGVEHINKKYNRIGKFQVTLCVPTLSFGCFLHFFYPSASFNYYILLCCFLCLQTSHSLSALDLALLSSPVSNPLSHCTFTILPSFCHVSLFLNLFHVLCYLSLTFGRSSFCKAWKNKPLIQPSGVLEDFLWKHFATHSIFPRYAAVSKKEEKEVNWCIFLTGTIFTHPDQLVNFFPHFFSIIFEQVYLRIGKLTAATLWSYQNLYIGYKRVVICSFHMLVCLLQPCKGEQDLPLSHHPSFYPY